MPLLNAVGATVPYIPLPFSGIVIPKFQTLSQFDNYGQTLPAVNFAIFAGGGLISATFGTDASGYLRLPQTLNGFFPTRKELH